MQNQEVKDESDAEYGNRTPRPVLEHGIGRFSERLKSAVERHGVRPIARKSGVGEKSIRGYISERSEPRRPALIALAWALEVDLEWLATGKSRAEVGTTPASAAPPHNEVFVSIPQYDVEVAAGDGRVPGSEEVMAYYAFRRDWIRQKGWDVTKLAIVICRGDSQEGLIDDGQPVLVDLADHDVFTEGLFVLRLDDHLLIKTVQMDLKGNALLRSNNPRYRELAIPRDEINQLQIVGRAIWTDHVL